MKSVKHEFKIKIFGYVGNNRMLSRVLSIKMDDSNLFRNYNFMFFFIKRSLREELKEGI